MFEVQLGFFAAFHFFYALCSKAILRTEALLGSPPVVFALFLCLFFFDATLFLQQLQFNTFAEGSSQENRKQFILIIQLCIIFPFFPLAHFVLIGVDRSTRLQSTYVFE